MIFRKIVCFLFLICFGCISPVMAQSDIEDLIVEVYYISDSNDASDTIGGGIEPGTVTYRVFLDLATGVKLRRVYGDENHPLLFESTEVFFNNKEDGQTFAERFNRSRFDENTVALDTWLALGKISTSVFGGVLKENDSNGSFIAGNGFHDGGSAELPEGLLNNNDPLLGIPLFESDGIDTLLPQPSSFGSFGFEDILTGLDSTIFGSIIPGNKFESRNAAFFNGGVQGVDSIENHILIAQLTTKGELKFKLNVEVERPTILGTEVVKYVTGDSVLLADETLSALLQYPPVCGCVDPNYLEYSDAYACSNPDSCQNLIVFGCTDPLACNFSADANFNLPEICCYIGDCNDLDISLVCPSLNANLLNKEADFEIHPNPTNGLLNAYFANFDGEDVTVLISDLSGRTIRNFDFKGITELSQHLDISGVVSGTYLVSVISKTFLRTVLIKKI